MNARTDLFVPGDRPERFAKALASGADAVGLDLEDAVAPERKAAAHDSVAAGLAGAGAAQRERIVVRTNDEATPWWADEARLLAELAWACGHGCDAKLCIHPQQVAPIHAARRPTDNGLEWARRVIAAAERQGGAVQVDARMVDRPVLQRARGLLARADR